ncbi:uncharacterized protein [Nicotiana sylvestris]|uniref:uncharacterized protein n=1 Tax=Nicotiana sylvestris TaxID=4096 RepID=UPI00388CB986
MRSPRDELHSSYVGPVCSCGAFPKFIEDQQLFQFLNGLNEFYSNVKSAIMMMNPLPPVSKAYSLLQHDESQKEAHSSILSLSGDTSSFLVSTDHQMGTGPSVKRLHGFPLDVKFTKNKKSASCVQPKHSFTPSTPLHSAPTIQFPESSAHDFTKEQYQHLLALFQKAQLSSGSTHDDSSVDNTTFAHFAGSSLKRPLKNGKAARRLYYLYPDDDLFPVKSTSMSASHSSVSLPVSLPVFVPSVNTSHVVDHVIDVVSCNHTSTSNKVDLFWHQRLRHMHFHKIKSMIYLSDKISPKQSFLCSICPMARKQRLSFPESVIHSTVPLQLVHIDIWGPYNTKTYNEFRYFLTIVNDYTRATWTHLLSCKSNVLSIIKAFTTTIKVHFKSPIKTFRSDNALELGDSSEGTHFFNSEGILDKTAISHTP